jgi:hypothetical protein
MFTYRSARPGAVALAAVALAGATTLAVAAPAGAATSRASKPHAVTYHFRTLNNDHDLTFNQLLGIDNLGLIAGYFGSGAAGHPNKGYLLLPPLYDQRSYSNQNFPGSVQTQVTGLNDLGVYVGFWSNTNIGVGSDANFGWYAEDGVFHEVNYPTSSPASPAIDQLLGVNDLDIAVGFYMTSSMATFGYEYNIRTHKFSSVEPGLTNVTAAAINNLGDVAGFYTNQSSGQQDGFLLRADGQFTDLAAPGACTTSALGVNDSDEVVGVYVPCSNPNALDGFTWTPRAGFTTVNDPNGVGTTTINGVNDAGDLVGFYTTDNGNITNGMLATP